MLHSRFSCWWGGGVALGFLFLKTSEWYKAQFVLPQSYFQSFMNRYATRGPVEVIMQNSQFRLNEFGQTFVNVPDSKAARVLPLVYVAGFCGWIAVLRDAYLSLRTPHLVPLVVNLLWYAAMIFCWPHIDGRFWIPLLPILAVMLFEAIHEFSGFGQVYRVMARLYLLWYFTLGILALGYSSRISMSGKLFSEAYGDGTVKMTYRHAFHNGLPVNQRLVNESQAKLLRLFEPLAQVGNAGK